MRLKELENRIDRIKPRDLILLCRMPDGTEQEMKLDEALHTSCDFIRVVGGNDVGQLNRLIEGFFGITAIE